MEAVPNFQTLCTASASLVNCRALLGNFCWQLPAEPLMLQCVALLLFVAAAAALATSVA
jgi:hypothetical protein